MVAAGVLFCIIRNNVVLFGWSMGHADVSVTLDTYTHIKEEDAKEEMERLGLLNVKEA